MDRLVIADEDFTASNKEIKRAVSGLQDNNNESVTKTTTNEEILSLAPN